MSDRASKRRISTVDGLRGLAALLVVFDHTVGDSRLLSAWAEQNHGIAVFAILTGVLIAAPFLRSRLDGVPRPDLGRFFRARFGRIFPGYWVALAIAALTVGLNSMGAGDWWRVITLTQPFGGDTPFEGIAPAWSLSLFLSFYLVIPAWWWARRAADGAGRPPEQVVRREVGWLLGVIAAALIVRATGATAAIAEDPAFTIFGRADWFAIGMLIGVALAARERGIGFAQVFPGAARAFSAARRPATAVAGLGARPGLTLLAALAFTVSSALISARHVELRDQLDTVAAALLVAAIVMHGPVLRGPQRLLATRPARALGRWSFGIFLWGYITGKAVAQLEPGIAAAPHLVLTLVTAIPIAAASWRFVERPVSERLRRAPRERAPRRPEPKLGGAPEAPALGGAFGDARRVGA